MTKIHNITLLHDTFKAYNNSEITEVLYPKTDYRFDTTNSDYLFEISEVIEMEIGTYLEHTFNDKTAEKYQEIDYWTIFYDMVEIENVDVWGNTIWIK